jgi:hypothetical protein
VTDEPEEDLAEFQFYAMGKRGARELIMRVHDERAVALDAVVKAWRACARLGDRRAVFEVALIPVDMSVIDDEPEASSLILPPGVQ